MSRKPIKYYPMVAATIPFMAGIVLFDWITMPMWALWGGFLLCLLLAAIGLQSRTSSLYITVALVLFGGAMISLRGFHPQVPLNERLYMTLEIDDNPIVSKGFAFMPARIRGYEYHDTEHSADERVQLYLDTLVKVDFGSRIEAVGRISPFPEKFGSYGKLMSRRGFGGTLFLRAEDILKVENANKRTLHTIAVERLARLGLSGDEAVVVGAMAVSDRRGMTSELRQAYARSGASHILAVSGLHIGIVFVLANLLLMWIGYFQYALIIKAVAVIAPIWIYTAMCGFSPSVVRAAIMFTALQLSVAADSNYISLNILAFTAFMMLVYRPDNLFDISFQLSFIAVVAIIVWGIPLMGLLRTHIGWIDALSTTMVVGLVASIATMPLVAYTFGTVSIVGVLLNPIVILCAYAIVMLAIIWIAIPIPQLAGLFGALLSAVSIALNFVVEWVASWQWSAIDFTLPVWAVWTIYGVAIAITIVISNIKPKKRIPLSL